jgi:hypothetical protein
MLMRIMVLLLLNLLTVAANAAIPAPPPAGNGPNNNNSTGNFGNQVQQNTGQALQVFQDVNYKKLSGAQDQNYFFSDDPQSADLSDLAQQFLLAPAN